MRFTNAFLEYLARALVLGGGPVGDVSIGLGRVAASSLPSTATVQSVQELVVDAAADRNVGYARIERPPSAWSVQTDADGITTESGSQLTDENGNRLIDGLSRSVLAVLSMPAVCWQNTGASDWEPARCIFGAIPTVGLAFAFDINLVLQPGGTSGVEYEIDGIPQDRLVLRWRRSHRA